jgi:hypothetical protein
MAVMGVMPFLLFLLTVVCMGLVWYTRRLLQQLHRVGDDIESVNLLVGGFIAHVESIHELEMFYGDETLQGLINHSKQTSSQLDEILERYDIEQEDLSDEEEEEPIFHQSS